MPGKHTRKEHRRRLVAFNRFVEANPPRMPTDFSNRDWKRVVKYALAAFVTGWNTGQHDRRVHGKGKPVRPTPTRTHKEEA